MLVEAENALRVSQDEVRELERELLKVNGELPDKDQKKKARKEPLADQLQA